MKKTLILIVIMFLASSCAPSESAIATAIAETQEIEEPRIAATQLAEIEQGVADNTAIENENEVTEFSSDPANTTITAEKYPFCRPNMVCEDLFDEPVASGYMDIIQFETSLDGETLTAIYTLADLPETFTINRDFVSIGWLEYSWTIEIDVDGDVTSGAGNFISGCEYFTNISHAKFEEGEISGPMDEVFGIYLAEIGEDSTFVIEEPEISVDYEKNQVTLVVDVPGINGESIFFVYTNEARDDDRLGSDWMDDQIILSELGRTDW